MELESVSKMKKPKAILFRYNRRAIEDSSQLKILGINVVENIKFLGVTVDNCLQFFISFICPVDQIDTITCTMAWGKSGIQCNTKYSYNKIQHM